MFPFFGFVLLCRDWFYVLSFGSLKPGLHSSARLFHQRFKTAHRTVVLVLHAGRLPRKARPDMAIERDNTAERLARIDKLVSETKGTPANRTTRVEAPQQVATVTKAAAPRVGRRAIA
jgi:hypothetical protein